MPELFKSRGLHNVVHGFFSPMVLAEGIRGRVFGC